MDIDTAPMADTVSLRDELEAVGIDAILSQLDGELIGLKPVKPRIREIASLLLIERIRKRMGVVMDISDRVVVLDYGKKIGDGTPEEVRSDQNVIDAYLGVPH